MTLKQINEFLQPLQASENTEQIQDTANVIFKAFERYTQKIIDLTSEGLQNDLNRLEMQVYDLQQYFKCNDISQHWDLCDFTDDQKNKVLTFNENLKTVLTGCDNNARTLYNLGSLFCNVIKTDAANEIKEPYAALLFVAIDNSINDATKVCEVVQMFYNSFDSLKPLL